MNQFIFLILNHLKDALFLAIFAVLICSVLLFFTKKRFDTKYEGTKTFPMKKTLLCLVFVAYIAVLLSATILRGGYGGGFHFHLFSGWVEAWNNFSVKSWLNLLLNIALFVPLGFLLPLLSQKFESPLLTFFTGLGTSLSIELVQTFLKRGLFDVDDLFTNTLGNFIGYSIILFILTLKNRPPKIECYSFSYLHDDFLISNKRTLKQIRKKLIGASIVPIATLLTIGGIFLAYQIKEYGNLPYAPTYRMNTKNVEWALSANLSNASPEVLIYKATPLTPKTCEDFGYAFMERAGHADGMLVQHYDEDTYFMNHTSGYFLEVSRYDGSYRFYQISMDKATPQKAEEATIREALAFYGISIPKNATFAYEGDGWHSFTVERTSQSELGGTLRCQYTTENKLCEIQNNLIQYQPYKTETILSPMEAYEKLTNGHFSANGYFEENLPIKAKVVSYELNYQIDTKGFYQPVYYFKVMLDVADTDSLILQVSAM